MDYPLVSVIMPVYNVAEFVAEAIKSVLSQTYSNIEFLIIDDGSSDKTNEICVDYEEQDNRIRVIRQKNAGAAAARNHGMREEKRQPQSPFKAMADRTEARETEEFIFYQPPACPRSGLA